jgi:hypothetical protein
MTLAEQIGKLYGDCSGPRGGRGGLPAVAVYRPQLRTVPRAVMTAEDRRGRLAELPDGLPD